MATLGQIDEFNDKKDDWLQYVKRSDNFFVSNRTDSAEKKQAVLQSDVGATTYKTLLTILLPEKPGEMSYAELVEALSKQFKSTLLEIVTRFKFNFRVQKAGESIAMYSG